MTDTEIIDRDTQILIYDLVGHDGSDQDNICANCGIILLRDYSKIPPKWGLHQVARGNLCQQCFADISSRYKKEIRILMSSPCWSCGSGDIGVFFYQKNYAGAGDIVPYRSVPACNKCKEKIREKEDWIGAIRDYHFTIGDHTVVLLGG